MKQSIATLSAVLVLGLSTAACGSASGSSGGSADAGSSKAATKTTKTTKKADPTLKPGPVCSRLDIPALGKTLGAGADWKVIQELKPGQQFQPYAGASKITAPNWTCDMSSKTLRLDLDVAVYGKPYTSTTFKSDVLDKFDTNMSSSQPAPTCSSGTPTGFGQITATRSCYQNEVKTAKQYSTGFAFRNVYGLYDGHVFQCGGITNLVKSGTFQARLTTLATQSDQACRSALASLGR